MFKSIWNVTSGRGVSVEDMHLLFLVESVFGRWDVLRLREGGGVQPHHPPPTVPNLLLPTLSPGLSLFACLAGCGPLNPHTVLFWAAHQFPLLWLEGKCSKLQL
jgi:hypothetical protein